MFSLIGISFAIFSVFPMHFSLCSGYPEPGRPHVTHLYADHTLRDPAEFLLGGVDAEPGDLIGQLLVPVSAVL